MDALEFKKLSKKIIKEAGVKGLSIASAESCTGGLISSSLTSVPGSSSVYDRGIITYSNQSKSDLLNIEMILIKKYGAVSKEIAILMAEGALNNSTADLSVSVTGVAGPGGGTIVNPVGRVHMAIAKKNTLTNHFIFTFENKGRDYIRESTTFHALENILKAL